MKRLIFILLACSAVNVSAQLAEPLQFQDKTHDFGEIVESNGPAVYEFSFLNKSTRPVKILAVQPSCGCTTPGWSKEPVAPGKTGFIKASFDPHGRPGYFNKSLTVTTDLDGNSIVLQIKGTVVDKKEEKGPYDLVIENGNLRLRNSSFNVGKVFVNKETTPVEFPIYNAGKDTLKFLEVISPKYIKVNVPRLIAPETKSSIKISYDAKLRNQYGFTSDNVLFKTNDKTQPDKYFSVYATTEEFFPILSPEEQTKAPVLNFETYTVVMGKLRKGIDFQRAVKFKNKGKKELIIRYVQSNCSCLISKATAISLKPMEEGYLQVTFNTDGREGLQNKAITIYSTDPINPVQRITLTGEIENE
ncbi:MAG: DUF1573 domain-containing protein [Cyclobacteriaceae bacterium]